MIQLQKAKSMCLSKTVQNKALLPLSDAALISLRLLTPNLKNFTPSPIKHKMTGKTWKCGYNAGAAASQLAAAKVTWAVLAYLVKLSGRNNYEMKRVLSNQKISPDKLFDLHFFAHPLGQGKWVQVQFPIKLKWERESTNPIRIQSQFVFFLCVYRAADELDCSLSGALLLYSLYRIFTLLYISDHSQRFCCGWWLYFWLHPEYSEWQYDSPEGLAWLWQSQQVKQDSCSTWHFFARKLKMSIKRGFFCANLGSSPNFAYHSQPSIRQPVLAFLSDPFCFLK